MALFRVKFWLFDFDNTLAALEPSVNWAQSRVVLEAYLREMGVGESIFHEFPRGNLLMYEALRGRLLDGPQSADARHHLIDGAYRPSSGEAAARANAAAVMRRASQIIEEYELAGVERAAPLPGAAELVNGLADAGRTVAIVTSNSSRTVLRWLERHKLGAKVAAVVGRDSELALKPSPAMLLCAMARIGGDVAAAIFVGDSEADFRAAAQAEIRFAGIARTPAARARLSALGAGVIFESPAALMRALRLRELNG